MRLGLFGGSFDPIHYGHLLLAQDVLENAQLDRVAFIPAAQAPLKASGAPVASADDRVAMINAAIAGRPEFSVLRDEINRGGVSYTVDTVRRLKARQPDDELFWILGGDQVAQLHEWREINELLELAGFLCLQRPDFTPIPPDNISAKSLHWISARQIDISSTEIRKRAASGSPLDFFLPPAVAQFITNNRLYRR
ncbi:nicotinate-nucleotide adenylyltransferase [Cerasicoccus arenae]|nr:nicotinate-nucleotide adenylyltransferase [Cerasicoccus arenae]MBK1858285.1 nicotinate-nucleotide adenylyltransferase [Cerasicoccus arenae]